MARCRAPAGVGEAGRRRDEQGDADPVDPHRDRRLAARVSARNPMELALRRATARCRPDGGGWPRDDGDSSGQGGAARRDGRARRLRGARRRREELQRSGWRRQAGEGIGDALREEMGVGSEERESIDERVAAAQRERSTGGSRARVRGGRGWALGRLSLGSNGLRGSGPLLSLSYIFLAENN